MAPHVAASIAASSLFLAHAWQQLSPFSLTLLPCDVLPCRQRSSTISCTAEKRTKKRWLKNTDNKRPLLKYKSMRLQRNSSTIRLRNYILENHLASNSHQVKQMANSSKLRKGRTRQWQPILQPTPLIPSLLRCKCWQLIQIPVGSCSRSARVEGCTPSMYRWKNNVL